METISIQSATFNDAYGISCAQLKGQNQKAGLYPTLCKIPAFGKTTSHSHFEEEVFFIIKGHGLLTLEGKSQNVSPGDLVRIPSFSLHDLLETAGEELHFLSVYSEDFTIPPLPKAAQITTAPPTPNGPLHLGHMSGPYLAADIIKRHLSTKGVSAAVASGTDDHQNYVVEKAQSQGLPTSEFHKKMRERILNGLAALSITADDFLSPSQDQCHQEKVRQFYKKTRDSRVTQEEIVSFPYCESCNVYLIDALISGHCPGCGEESRGGCEACGLVVPPYELLSPSCGRCGKNSTPKTATVDTFSLGQHLHLILDDLNELRLPPTVKDLVSQVKQRKELKVLLTYPGDQDWSIKSPEGRNLHVWFEMAGSYEEFSKDEKYWVHCFGFDNAFYYLLFIPALLKAMNPLAKLPDTVVTNEFLTLEGLKFSTSRNHAIWADEFQGNTDHLRLYLSYKRPSIRTSDFILRDFEAFSEELESQLLQINKWSRELLRSSIIAEKEAIVMAERLSFQMNQCLHPENLDLRQGARILLAFLDLILEGNWSSSSKLFLIQTWANNVSPFMPRESQKLLHNLNHPQEQWPS